MDSQNIRDELDKELEKGEDCTENSSDDSDTVKSEDLLKESSGSNESESSSNDGSKEEEQLDIKNLQTIADVSVVSQ